MQEHFFSQPFSWSPVLVPVSVPLLVLVLVHAPVPVPSLIPRVPV